MSRIRDPRLHGLSHEHHHALVLARRARLAEERAGRDGADGSGGVDQAALWASIQEEFKCSILPHFVVEEELMLPQLRARGEVEIVERTLREHAELRELIASEAPRLAAFGEALFAHVRFEESVLFDRAQEQLSDEELEALERARPIVQRS